MSAFVSNPMEHAEASKISLYSVADYTWNMENYDSETSWKHAVRDLMPLHAEYLEIFATHNSTRDRMDIASVVKSPLPFSLLSLPC